ncbi:MAG: hypothetical protein ABIH76_08795 [Candidatus Bathyarchaeota archaeon]
MDKPLMIIAGILISLGIILTRVSNFMHVQSIHLFLLYLTGFALALAGLGVLTLGLKKLTVKVRCCPKCLTPNPLNVERCGKCSESLKRTLTKV